MPQRLYLIPLLAAAIGLGHNTVLAGEDHPNLSPGDEAYSAERYDEAAALYRKDAEMGVIAAQVNLAFLYLDGMGVAQSDKDAATWFQRAAEQGNAEAQQNLGSLYQDGKGVKQDIIEAYKWFSLAGAKGNIDALDKQLKPEQLAEATKRIETWRANHKAPAAR